MLKKIKQDFTLTTWMLIPIAIVVNGAGGWIIAKLDVPFYIDTIGTIFISIVAGPFAGALTGIITNVLIGFFAPGYIPYWPVPFLIGLVAGFFADVGWFKNWWKVMVVGFFIAMVAATTSSLVATKVFGDASFSFSYFFIKEPLDKIATSLIAFCIAHMLPKQVIALLPRPENIESKEK